MKILIIPSYTYLFSSTFLKKYGWGSAYVSVPVGHPLHGISIDQISSRTLGGLSYSGFAGNLHFNQKLYDYLGRHIKSPEWLIGIDTLNDGDNLRFPDYNSILNQGKFIRSQLMNMYFNKKFDSMKKVLDAL